jgi:hypothetical protein
MSIQFLSHIQPKLLPKIWDIYFFLAPKQTLMVAAAGFLIPAPPLHLHVSTNPPLPCPLARRPTSRFHTSRWPQTWPCLQRSHRRALVLLVVRPWPYLTDSRAAAAPLRMRPRLTPPPPRLSWRLHSTMGYGHSAAAAAHRLQPPVLHCPIANAPPWNGWWLHTPVCILPYYLLGALAPGITVPRCWMTLFIRCTDTTSSMVYVWHY